jgi:cell shape-determining protein MreC
VRAVAVLATFVAFSATAEDGVQAPVKCVQGVCIMPAQFVKDMIDAHNELVDENRALKEQKETKCAKTEVTEPSKEKEAPLKPPFKLERNS